jgi:hypothetical protein
MSVPQAEHDRRPDGTSAPHSGQTTTLVATPISLSDPMARSRPLLVLAVVVPRS